MDLDSRKNEAKNDLKRFDISVEVRLLVACCNWLLTHFVHRRRCSTSPWSPSTTCEQTWRRFGGTIFATQSVSQTESAQDTSLTYVGSLSVALSGFLLVIVVSMELLVTRQKPQKVAAPSPPPSRAPDPYPLTGDAQRTIWQI